MQRKPLHTTSKEQARLDNITKELLMNGTAISESQNKLQALFVRQENLKGKLAATIEMVCEAHGVQPADVRANRDADGRLTLTTIKGAKQ
jgi:hypothetical protein